MQIGRWWNKLELGTPGEIILMFQGKGEMRTYWVTGEDRETRVICRLRVSSKLTSSYHHSPRPSPFNSRAQLSIPKISSMPTLNKNTDKNANSEVMASAYFYSASSRKTLSMLQTRQTTRDWIACSHSSGLRGDKNSTIFVTNTFIINIDTLASVYGYVDIQPGI